MQVKIIVSEDPAKVERLVNEELANAATGQQVEVHYSVGLATTGLDIEAAHSVMLVYR